MRKKLRSHLTYANVTATLGLFVALSTGGAYAANTIRSSDIVDGEVKTQDLAAGGVTNSRLANNAVTTGKVTDSTLTTHDVNNGTLSGLDVSDNTLGALDIAQNAVGTSEVANGTLQSQDFAPGTLGTFRAYGRIDEDGSVSRSKNVVKVDNFSPGDFCITLAAGIDPSQSAPVVTPDSITGATSFVPNGSQAIVEVDSRDSAPPGCSSSQVGVQTGFRAVVLARDQNGNLLLDSAGHPWVRRVDNVPWDQSFFFVLP
jgi:hypothetical protein